MKRREFLTVTAALAAAPLTFAAETPTLTPTTARIWRGRTTRARADEYAAYLYEEGIKPLHQAALRVQLFRDTEFVVISYWESVEAMARYAGPEYRKVHPLPRDAELLIELPKTIQVMKILADLGSR
jgi:hypothetical protein